MEKADKIWKEHQQKRELNIDEWNSHPNSFHDMYEEHKVKLNRFVLKKDSFIKDSTNLKEQLENYLENEKQFKVSLNDLKKRSNKELELRNKNQQELLKKQLVHIKKESKLIRTQFVVVKTRQDDLVFRATCIKKEENILSADQKKINDLETQIKLKQDALNGCVNQMKAEKDATKKKGKIPDIQKMSGELKKLANKYGILNYSFKDQLEIHNAKRIVLKIDMLKVESEAQFIKERLQNVKDKASNVKRKLLVKKKIESFNWNLKTANYFINEAKKDMQTDKKNFISQSNALDAKFSILKVNCETLQSCTDIINKQVKNDDLKLNYHNEIDIKLAELAKQALMPLIEEIQKVEEVKVKAKKIKNPKRKKNKEK